MPRAVLDWPTTQPDFVFMCLLRALESLGNPSAGLLGVSVLFSPGQIAVPLVLSRPSVSTFGEGGGKVFRSRWMRASELGPCLVTGSGSTAIDKSVSAVMSSVWLVFVQCFRRSSGVQVDSRRGPRPGFGSKWVLPIDVSW